MSGGAHQTALGSVVPVWAGGSGGGGAVDSVFGRVGVVVAVLGDYSSSLVTNTSGVAGATVTDALNALNAASGVTSVFGRTGAVVAVLGDYSTDLITQIGAIPAGSLTLTDALAGAPAALDIYISPATGNDANAGTLASPIATVVEAVRRLSLYQRIRAGARVVFHLDAGPHVWATIPWLAADATLGVYADPAFDATVRTTTVTDTTDVGTDANVVVAVGGGLVPDAHIKSWIMITGGAANGQIRSIQSNTATNIVPAQVFAPPPGVGDTFIIFDVNCVITAPAGSLGLAQFSVGSPASGGRVHPSAAGSTVASKTSGIVVVGVEFSTAAAWLFGSGALELYGCRSATTSAISKLIFGCETVGLGIGGVPSLINQFLNGNLYLGWGCSFEVAFGTSVATRVSGYLVSSEFLFSQRGVPPAAFFFFGGRFTNGFRIEGAAAWIEGSSVRPFQLDCDGVEPAVEARNDGYINLTGVLLTGNTAALPLLRVSELGQIVITATVTGANAGAGLTVSVRYGGQLVIDANIPPVLGNVSPATDWDIEDGAPFDNAFFAAVGDRKFFEGNLAIRVDN